MKYKEKLKSCIFQLKQTSYSPFSTTYKQLSIKFYPYHKFVLHFFLRRYFAETYVISLLNTINKGYKIILHQVLKIEVIQDEDASKWVSLLV